MSNNKVIHNHYYGGNIKWTGENTQRNIMWIYGGDTYKEIYDQLVEDGVISTSEYFPDEKAMIEKAGHTLSEMCNHDGDEYQEWFDKITENIELTDEDYEDIISNENGNAYYQKFEIKK